MKKFIYLLASIVVSLLSLQPLFSSGFFSMHDDTQVARVFEMGIALRDGMFPVRWVSHLGYGYGYPIFNFYAPLAYYVGGALVAFNIDSLLATKIMIGIGVVLSGIGMYLFVRQIWGNLSGVLSSILYILAPFHAIDIYVRGAVSELWAYAFIPFVFYGLYKAVDERSRSGVSIAAIAFAAVITSHNLTALMLLPFLALLFCFLLMYRFSLSTVLLFFLPLALGIFLSAFYWVPAIAEMSYTNVLSQVGGGADFRDHFVCLSQLWDSMWGFGGSVPGCIDGLSFRLGKIHIITTGVAFCLYLVVGRKLKNRFTANIPFYFLFSFFVSVFLMLSVSKPIWEVVKSFSFIQYPWRFLVFASFFSSLSVGYISWLLPHMFQKGRTVSIIFAVLVAVGSVITYGKLFYPQVIHYYGVSHYTSRDALTWRTSKISDEYMPKNFQKPVSSKDVPIATFIPTQGIQVKELVNKTHNKVYVIEAEKTAKVHANIAFFPSWQVKIDGNSTNFLATEKGIDIIVPQGKHTVSFVFTSTFSQIMGNGITLIGIVALVTAIIYWRLVKLYAKIT